MKKLKYKNLPRVIVAMSGGLDSSVAAALLKKSGFDVVGVFMKFWSAPKDNDQTIRFNRCCSLEAEVRARKVAQVLKIPFYIFNFEEEFKKRIVDYFLDGYKKGITPNPCVVCNKEIKFGLLLEKALKLDADFIATGHYAITNLSNLVFKKKIFQSKKFLKSEKDSEIKLFRAKDKEKDQSYFLWMLNQNQLKRVLFPVGDYRRFEVEKLAKRFKIDFLLKIPKSMEICFIQTTVNEFLRRYLKTKPGPIYLKESLKEKIVGQHQGLAFYTIGQRKGISLPGGPYWVLKKDLERNALLITKKEDDLYKKELIFKDVNWISDKKPKLPLKVKAKIRYRNQLTSAFLTSESRDFKIYRLIFEKPQWAITSGQSVVFYQSQTLLGGGIIW